MSALAEKDSQSIVWTVDRGADTVHARPVKVAKFAADGVRVAEGLKPGDIVSTGDNQKAALLAAANRKVRDTVTANAALRTGKRQKSADPETDERPED